MPPKPTCAAPARRLPCPRSRRPDPSGAARCYRRRTSRRSRVGRSGRWAGPERRAAPCGCDFPARTRRCRRRPRFCLPSSLGEVRVRGDRLEADVIDRAPHREVIEDLEAVTRKLERPMRDVVEEAADAGGADTRRLGLEVELLAHDAGFPMETPVEPGAESFERGTVLRKHRRCEDAVGRDVLTAARLRGDPARIACFE